jgi:hypothetical protein
MKLNLLPAILLLLFSHTYSQQLTQVNFSGGTNFLYFAIATNQNVLVRISDEGKIVEYGTEEQSLYNRNYYAPKLRPFLGRIDYYGNESDTIFRGKIKNIGSCIFTYYPANDYPERAGKLRTAGSLMFDYYRKYEDALIAGKIKSIGSNAIMYYTSFDNEAFKGKLKMIGSTSITYYSSFDNTQLKGKLKTVGNYRYDWKTFFNGQQLSTSLNSGYQRQVINGIAYIAQ